MANMMQFDLVSPERKLASLEASKVQIPGAEGDLTAMPNHAPFLTTLRPGVVTVTEASGETEFVVTGGFAEVSATGTSVLAERAMPKEEATKEVLEGLLAVAEETLTSVSEAEAKTAAALRVNDYKALIAQLAG